MNRLWRWIKPPTFDDKEKMRAARTLYLVIGVYIVIFAIGAITSAIFASEFGSRLPLTLIAALSGVVMLVILRAGHLRITGYLLLGISLAVSAYFTATAGGVERPAASLFLVTVVFAGLALGKFAILIALLASVFADFLFYFMSQARIMPPPVVQLVPTSALVTNLITLLAISACLYLAIANLEAAINRVKASERILAERNRQLEQEIIEHRRTAERLRLASEAGKINIWERDVATDRVIYDGYLFEVDNELEDNKSSSYLREMERIHPDDRERVEAMVRYSMAEEGAQSEEFRVKLPNGQYIWLQSRAESIRDETGKVTHLLGVNMDITERKLAEQERLELAVERGKLAALRDFLDTVSHDLKTPLSVISTSLYLLERLDDSTSREEHLQKIKRQTKLLREYIQNILLMSRLDHIPDLDFEKLDINTYARQVEAEIRLDDTHKGVNIRLELGSALPYIRASDEELHRLVTNLLENAVIYTPEGGSVTIRTYLDKTNVVLEIADTGIGIEEEEQLHIFENFYRTDRARKHSSGGTGLGLSIVKRIADLHGASIQVESRPGQGSCFRVSFPTVD